MKVRFIFKRHVYRINCDITLERNIQTSKAAAVQHVVRACTLSSRNKIFDGRRAIPRSRYALVSKHQGVLAYRFVRTMNRRVVRDVKRGSRRDRDG